MSYIQISGVPRNVVAEESLTITLSGTPIAHPDATKCLNALMIRGRLQGGPIRFRFLTPPTTTDGTPLYDSDVVEWTTPEFSKLVSTSTGGLIVASTATANAILFLTYYA